MTVGRVGAGPVLKLHTKLLVSAFPARSVTPVVIVAVNRVLGASKAAEVKVATAPVQLTVPGTTVVPGPVRIKLVAGDLSVAQFTASLKVAVSA
jgi:hypothetical protein